MWAKSAFQFKSQAIEDKRQKSDLVPAARAALICAVRMRSLMVSTKRSYNCAPGWCTIAFDTRFRFILRETYRNEVSLVGASSPSSTSIFAKATT